MLICALAVLAGVVLRLRLHPTDEHALRLSGVIALCAATVAACWHGVTEHSLVSALAASVLFAPETLLLALISMRFSLARPARQYLAALVCGPAIGGWLGAGLCWFLVVLPGVIHDSPSGMAIGYLWLMLIAVNMVLMTATIQALSWRWLHRAAFGLAAAGYAAWLMLAL